jgi:acyl carrier protein
LGRYAPANGTASAAATTHSIERSRQTGTRGYQFDAGVDYILSPHPSRFNHETLPRDESLLELEALDSAGVIEFIVFAETTWGIEISDDDITKERMGSLNKMAALVQEYAVKKITALCGDRAARIRSINDCGTCPSIIVARG